jgi:hypothetical protein
LICLGRVFCCFCLDVFFDKTHKVFMFSSCGYQISGGVNIISYTISHTHKNSTLAHTMAGTFERAYFR